MEYLARVPSKALRQRTSICRFCCSQLQKRSQLNGNHRPYHQTARRRDRHQDINTDTATQAHPLGDFYADLLARPIPRESRASTAEPPSSSSSLPAFVATGGDLTKEERAARLFGNIQGSGYERRTISETPDATWRTVNGVPIPPRPAEPDNCCMSGCVHCVWDDYRDDIEQWAGRLREAQAKAGGTGMTPETKTPKVQLARPEVEVASVSMDDDGGGSEALWQSPSQGGSQDGDDLFAGIPIGIREFMNVEKMIRERKRERQAQAP